MQKYFTIFYLLAVTSVFAIPAPRSREGKVVGGEDAAIGQFPHHVMIRLKNNGLPWCGGAIIREDLILTVAHCVESFQPNSLEIIAGKHHRDQVDENEQIRDIRRKDLHEDYDWVTSTNDIALLHLASNLTYNEFVQPAQLPLASREPTTEMFVTGWGAINQDGTMADVLQYIQVPMVDDQNCTYMHPDYYVDRSMLCVGPLEGGKEACYGDAGSPVVEIDGGPLVGLVCWGALEGCALPNKPSVLTQISYFLEWINTNAGN